MRPTPLRLLPLTCHLPRLESAIAEARRFARLCPLVIVVMHHYDFPGEGKAVFREHGEFDALLSWVAEQADVQVKTLAQLATELTPAASRLGFAHRRLRNRLPWRLRRWLPDLSVSTRRLWLP
jgi:hypothetical protein